MTDIKPATVEYPKTYRKCSKTITHAKKVSHISGAAKHSTGPLHSETMKTYFFIKTIKI